MSLDKIAGLGRFHYNSRRDTTGSLIGAMRTLIFFLSDVKLESSVIFDVEMNLYSVAGSDEQ